MKTVDLWARALQEGLTANDLTKYEEARKFASQFDGMGSESCHSYAVWCIKNNREVRSQQSLFDWSDQT